MLGWFGSPLGLRSKGYCTSDPWGLPKIRGRHNKEKSILGSILGSLVFGNYHMDKSQHIKR